MDLEPRTVAWSPGQWPGHDCIHCMADLKETDRLNVMVKEESRG